MAAGLSDDQSDCQSHCDRRHYSTAPGMATVVYLLSQNKSKLVRPAQPDPLGLVR